MDSDHPPAPWWPCLCPNSVSDLRRLEKKWNFRDSPESWTWCWNVFRTYMTESVNISLFVQCPGEYSFMRFWLSFFRRGTGFDMKIPRKYLYRNVGNSVPKLIWPQMDSNWSFCLNVPRFTVVTSAYTKGCKSCSILFLFCWHEVFPVNYLWVFVVCSLNVPYFLDTGFFRIEWWANYLSFLCFCDCQLFLQLVIKSFFDYF